MLLSTTINFARAREYRVRDWVSWHALTTELARLSRRARYLRARTITLISSFGLLISIIVSGVFLFPDALYSVLPFEPVAIEAKTDSSPLGGAYADGALYSEIILPARNENLPAGNWLIIPKIGLRTEIRESEDPEDSLRYGVWRETELATPEELGPMILIAHRYGYLKWSNQYRHLNSFYNLPKLEVGDTFEVIWDQRRYEYEIYAGEEGEEITDYDADIILYTCKFLNSPVRIFRYARRVSY